MFESKERIEKLEGQVAALMSYCRALEKEQEEMYIMIVEGLRCDLDVTTGMYESFNKAKDSRRRAFNSLNSLFKALM